MKEETKGRRLGAGLTAIFGNMNESVTQGAPTEIELSKIKIAHWQPRKMFDEKSLNELAESIKRYGVLQPILLKKGENDEYTIIAGERRFRAAQIAQKQKIPAIILNFDEAMSLEISMLENLQRKDLNPVEKAHGFAFLIEKLNLTQNELAQRLSISRSEIANYLRINTLPDDIKDKLIAGKISFGHAKILVNKAKGDVALASRMAQKIVEEKISIRDLEKSQNDKLEITISKKKAPEFEQFEQMISKQLNAFTTIEVAAGAKNGVISLHFKDLIQLEEIIEKICL